ncbi:hypothetical protein FCM35_KLT14049 [Carex littledalei]|uniref:Uncharacterized protein n=1 Tax=Carex littledalei TaxID=544730 RepID=A0A833QLE1_9POAL|nr:hypothetical protein FCM35_KLT14049 [Carex littledalei]
MEAALHRDEKLANQLAAFGLLGRTNPAASPKPAPSSSPIPFEAPKRGYCAASMPISDLPPFNPIYVQRQGFRGWFFESEPGRVRFVPVRGSGPAKKSGGTGVFLPRVSVKEEVNKRNNSKGREQRKPQQPQRHELVGPTFQPSSAELASLLPQEWSY